MTPSRPKAKMPDRRKSVPRGQPPTKAETVAVVIILLFPCMGTFFAPETYFAPQEFSLQAARETVESDMLIGRATYFLVLLWLVPQYLRSSRIMLSAALRSTIPIIFVLWMTASALWSADPSGSFNRSGRTFILVLFAIYLAERYDTQQLVQIVTITGAIAILASIIAVIALPTYGYSALNGYEGAWRGATIHKNSLGALMTVLLPFGYCALRTRHGARRVSLFVVLGSLFLAAMSRSATSMLVVGIAIAAIFALEILNAFKYQSEKVFAAIIILFFFGFAYALHSQADKLLMLLGRDASFTGRTEVWQRVATLIAERPYLGYGHGFWGIDSPERDGIWTELGWAAPHAHNTFLDIRLQLGLIGVVLAVCMFAITIWRTGRLIWRGVPSAALIWPLIILATLFRGLTETYLVDPGSSGLFWCGLAFAAISRLAAETGTASAAASGLRSICGDRRAALRALPPNSMGHFSGARRQARLAKKPIANKSMGFR